MGELWRTHQLVWSLPRSIPDTYYQQSRTRTELKCQHLRRRRWSLCACARFPGVRVRIRVTNSQQTNERKRHERGGGAKGGILEATSALCPGACGRGPDRQLRGRRTALCPLELGPGWAREVVLGGGRRGSHGDGACSGKRPRDSRGCVTSGRAPWGDAVAAAPGGHLARVLRGLQGPEAGAERGPRARRRRCQRTSGQETCTRRRVVTLPRSLGGAVARRGPANFSP